MSLYAATHEDTFVYEGFSKKYKNVNARRLNSSNIDQLMYRSYDIYHRVMADIYDSLNYQYQFYWSGDLNDKNIDLVDDGLVAGATCTDYWLTLFEEMAGIGFLCVAGKTRPVLEDMVLEKGAICLSTPCGGSPTSGTVKIVLPDLVREM